MEPTMTTEVLLVNGEMLIGKVTKPFIQDGKLMGAVLSFEGRSETALLHRKQMVGANKNTRLSNTQLGAEMLVRIIVSGEQPDRKVWASELTVDNEFLIERIKTAPKVMTSTVINSTDYGVFVEVQEGPAAGRRGLIHAKNLGTRSGPVRLGAFTSYETGASVQVRLLNASVDGKGVLRLDLAVN
jgi:hypothetical protein